MFKVDQIKLQDAKKLSEPEYFLKYGEHPKVIIMQAGDRWTEEY